MKITVQPWRLSTREPTFPASCQALPSAQVLNSVGPDWHFRPWCAHIITRGVSRQKTNLHADPVENLKVWGTGTTAFWKLPEGFPCSARLEDHYLKPSPAQAGSSGGGAVTWMYGWRKVYMFFSHSLQHGPAHPSSLWLGCVSLPVRTYLLHLTLTTPAGTHINHPRSSTCPVLPTTVRCILPMPRPGLLYSQETTLQPKL